MRCRINEKWNEYAKCLPKDCSVIQRKETRQAFYMGATSLFFLLLNILEDGEDATEKDLKVMGDIHKELENFSKEIK